VIGRLLAALADALLLWYGLMLALLALKVSPHAVNEISGYRTIFDWLAGLQATDTVRAATAAAGLALCAVCAVLAWRSQPRRTPALELPANGRGSVTVAARAIERMAERAAAGAPSVTSASARHTGGAVEIDLTVSDPRALDASLSGAQKRTAEAFATHEIPPPPLNVTLARIATDR
jgi:hypothetical protein